MKLSMKEKKILYAFACPSHDNMVARLKWLTALTVDPEAKRWMLELARKMETEVDEKQARGLLPPAAQRDGRIPPSQAQFACA